MPAIAGLPTAGGMLSRPLPRQPDEGIGGWAGQGPCKGAGEAMGVQASCGLRGAGHDNGRDALPNQFITPCLCLCSGRRRLWYVRAYVL